MPGRFRGGRFDAETGGLEPADRSVRPTVRIRRSSVAVVGIFRPASYAAILECIGKKNDVEPVIDAKDVRIERTFDVPIDLIWAMWTEAEHFANWYGPMVMFFVGEYRDVDPKTRLVYTESMADAEGIALTAELMGMPAGTPTETSIVVELVDLGDRTKMTVTHVGVPADSPGGQGWAMAIDKIEARIDALRR